MHYRVRPREADVLQPDEYHARFTDTAFGRMRSRSLGAGREGVPPVVAVQGMAVSDYLLPALAVLGGWTRTHLVDLPGLAGSGPAKKRLDVPGYAAAVTAWLDHAELSPVVLIGHSSSTQVVAHIAADRPDLVHAVVLASPTVDPAARSWPRLLLRWRWDSRYPAPGLQQQHIPEWVRAGCRQIRHLVAVHLHDRLGNTITRIHRPVLVMRGEQDGISTEPWARGLAESCPDGRFVAVPGPHTFVWTHPEAWGEPVRALAATDGAR